MAYQGEKAEFEVSKEQAQEHRMRVWTAAFSVAFAQHGVTSEAAAAMGDEAVAIFDERCKWTEPDPFDRNRG